MPEGQNQDSDMPQIMTGMQEVAAVVHEVFITLQGAGFRHDEAFQLVSNLMNMMVAEGIQQSRQAKGA
jgi:hypothetical protein